MFVLIVEPYAWPAKASAATATTPKVRSCAFPQSPLLGLPEQI